MKIRGQEVIDLAVRIQQQSVIDPVTQCWNWQGSKRNGYGRMTTGSRAAGTRKTMSAHRVSYETFVGAIPNDMEICHQCDNPGCVNPNHLFAGTKQDNTDDRERKGRNRPSVGEQNGRAKLTDADVISARRLRTKGMTYQAIAERFSVDKKTAMRAIKGKCWAHVEIPEAPAASKEGDNRE